MCIGEWRFGTVISMTKLCFVLSRGYPKSTADAVEPSPAKTPYTLSHIGHVPDAAASSLNLQLAIIVRYQRDLHSDKTIRLASASTTGPGIYPASVSPCQFTALIDTDVCSRV